MNKVFLMVTTVIVMFHSSSYAATTHCDNFYISDVWVEGARDDNHALANKVVVRIKDSDGSYKQCGGKDYLHIENTSPAYSGMLSIALTAQTTGKKVEIAINTSTTTAYSNQLAFIRIKDK
jgi:hypothetical protein